MRESATANRIVGLRNLGKMVPGRLVTQAVGLISVIAFARLMGAETYGRYASVIALLTIVQTAAACGLPMVEVRFLAPLAKLERTNDLLALAGGILRLRMAIAVAAALVAGVWLALSQQVLSLPLTLCIVLGVAAFLRHAFEATRSLLLPLDRAGALILLDVARAVGTLVLVAVSYVAFGLEVALAMLLPLYLVLSWSSAATLHRRLPGVWKAGSVAQVRPHAAYGAFSLVGELSTLAAMQSAIYLVATLNTLTAAGLVALALQVFFLLNGLSLTVRRALLPSWSRDAAEEQISQLQDSLQSILAAAAIIVSLLCVLWVFWGLPVLQLVLGESYAAAHPAVALIFLGAVAQAAGNLIIGVLYALHRAGSAAISEIVFGGTLLGTLLVLHISEHFALSPPLVAAAFSLASLAALVFGDIALRRSTTLSIAWWRIALPVLPALIAVGLLIRGEPASVLGGLVATAVAILFYAALLKWYGFSVRIPIANSADHSAARDPVEAAGRRLGP